MKSINMFPLDNSWYFFVEEREVIHNGLVFNATAIDSAYKIKLNIYDCKFPALNCKTRDISFFRLQKAKTDKIFCFSCIPGGVEVEIYLGTNMVEMTFFMFNEEFCELSNFIGQINETK